MTTPLSRARTTLRAIHRFKAGLRHDMEAGVPGTEEAIAEVTSHAGGHGEMPMLALPVLN